MTQPAMGNSTPPRHGSYAMRSNLFDLPHLPLHPTLRHPLTGERLRATYRDKHGRLRWPVIGAEDDDEAKKKAEAEAAAKKKADDEAAAKKKADDEAAAKKKAAEDGKSGGDDKGFPANTPVAEMTDKQQAAYWRHYARRHEDNEKSLRDAAGERTPEQIKADAEELEKLRREKRSEHENAVADAEKKGQQKAQATFSQQLVKAELRGRLASLEDVEVQGEGAAQTDKRDRIIAGLNLQQFVTDDGDVDTAKVKAYVSELVEPAKGGSNGRTDYGAGRRTGETGSGVQSGADAYRKRHPSKEKVA